MGQELAEKHGFQYIETSAKDSINIDEAFELLISASLEAIGAHKHLADQHVDVDAEAKDKGARKKCNIM